MWYYIKQSVISLGYLVMMSFCSIFVSLIGNDLIWLKWIFSIMILAVYIMIVGISSYKDGEISYKKLLANDLERRRIIETGEDIPLNVREEYRPWKGFLTGFITCIPLFVLLILHTILGLTSNGTNLNAGATAVVLYMPMFIFFHMDTSVNLVFVDYYWLLIAVPIIFLTTGLPYIWGTFKEKRTQEIVRQRKEEIYGKTE